MAETADIPNWILMFMGVYALAASVGEFRSPGFWQAMVGELTRSRGLQFLTGIACITIGAAIYLASPYNPGDWVSVIVTLLGAWMVIEGAAILAFGDMFLKLADKLMGAANRVWASLSALVGVVAIVVALMRL